MKKLTVLLVMLAFFVFSVSGFAVPAYVNVGPTTEFNGDIKIIDEIEAEGSTPDEFETVLTFTDPTADRTITVPDSNQTIGTATTITDDLIVADDFSVDNEPADNDLLTYDTTGGNFAWETIGELSLVTKTGTPADSQIAVWTADGIIEGAASLTYDGSNLQLTGDIGSTGTKITKGWFTDLVVTNDIAGSITGNAETVTTADNEAENEENEVPFVAGAAGPGDAALESDSGFTYNPSTGMLTAAGFTGALTGNADTITVSDESADETCFVGFYTDASGSLAGKTGDNLTFNSSTGVLTATGFSGPLTGSVTGDLTGNADTFTATDNENEALACPIVFVDGATGDQGAETDDTDFTYTPSTGTVTATEFVGGGAGVTGVTATANYILHLMDVDAADTDYVHLAITGTGASNDVSTAITNPDYGRNITITHTYNDSPSGNVTITGTLADGTTGQTDVIAIAGGASTVQGVKAFTYVSNINIPAGVPAGDTVSIGIGDVIGLQNAINAEADIYLKTVDGVEEYGEISGNGNTTYNTLNCATIVQNEDITIYYHP